MESVILLWLYLVYVVGTNIERRYSATLFYDKAGVKEAPQDTNLQNERHVLKLKSSMEADDSQYFEKTSTSILSSMSVANIQRYLTQTGGYFPLLNGDFPSPTNPLTTANVVNDISKLMTDDKNDLKMILKNCKCHLTCKKIKYENNKCNWIILSDKATDKKKFHNLPVLVYYHLFHFFRYNQSQSDIENTTRDSRVWNLQMNSRNRNFACNVTVTCINQFMDKLIKLLQYIIYDCKTQNSSKSHITKVLQLHSELFKYKKEIHYCMAKYFKMKSPFHSNVTDNSSATFIKRPKSVPSLLALRKNDSEILPYTNSDPSSHKRAKRSEGCCHKMDNATQMQHAVSTVDSDSLSPGHQAVLVATITGVLVISLGMILLVLVLWRKRGIHYQTDDVALANLNRCAP